MHEILISIIVPVYNTAPWLPRCLDSICSQSYQNLEILCVNDGSTDNSAEILAEYAAKDARIKVFTQANAGLSAARNTGLEHATGEWVTGVDSDDYLYPGAYESAVNDISDEVDMVFFGVQEVTEDGTSLPHNVYFDLPVAGEYPMTPELAAKLNVCFVSKLWRRSMLEENKLRFPVGLVHEDEAMFYLAAPYTRKVAICPAMGYAYMQRAGSIMNEVGVEPLNQVRRRISILEFVHSEYGRRDMLHHDSCSYLKGMFVKLCPCWYWFKPQELRPVARQLVGQLIQNCNMTREDYRLERFVPVTGWRSLFLSRYTCAKVYKLLGIPIWIKWYTYSGRRITWRILLFHAHTRLCRCAQRMSK